MKRLLVVVLLGGTVFVTRVAADEGRIPIFAPTVITQPGGYILTRDISRDDDVVVDIQASGVTLDLNGHMISNSTTVFALVQVGQGATDVTVRNGRLSGGSYGILYGSAAPRTRIRLEALEVTNPGAIAIFINGAEQVDVVSCRILGGPSQPNGVEVFGVSGSFGGRFVNNTIETQGGTGLHLSGLYGGEVRGNRVGSAIKTGSPGVIVTGPAGTCGNNLIEGNVVTGSASAGISLTAGCDSNLVVDNVVSANRSTGISAGSGGNRISGNILAGNLSVGIGVSGSRNLIEGNQVKDNSGCGLNFTGAGAENAYRDNMLRGNMGGAVCGSATDAGGNIL